MSLKPHESDWLTKYRAALADEDLSKMLSLLQGAPSMSGASESYANEITKHRRNYFDKYVRSQYDPKDHARAYEAFTKNIQLPNVHPSTVAAAGKTNPMPSTVADSVKAAAAKQTEKEKKTATVVPSGVAQQSVPPQKTIHEQQVDDIHKRGMLTADEQDKRLNEFGTRAWNEAYPKEQIGSYEAFQAAMKRGGHADAMARNLRSGKYAYLDPNSPEGRKATEEAYNRHFTGQNWAGENPVTGEYKHKYGGQAFSSKGAWEASQNPELLGMEQEAQDNADESIAAALRQSQPLLNEEKRKSDAYVTAYGKANELGDSTLDYVGSQLYHSPDFMHWTKGNNYAQVVDQTSGMLNAPFRDGGKLDFNPMPDLQSVSDSIRLRMNTPSWGKTILAPKQPYRVPKWNEKTGGYSNGRWFSAGD